MGGGLYEKNVMMSDEQKKQNQLIHIPDDVSISEESDTQKYRKNFSLTRRMTKQFKDIKIAQINPDEVTFSSEQEKQAFIKK